MINPDLTRQNFTMSDQTKFPMSEKRLNSFGFGRHKPNLFFIYIYFPTINKYAQFLRALWH